MSREEISIRTPDGDCRAFLFTPGAGEGPWPAAILYMDGLAIRPALLDMGQLMADGGYVVLLPDLFYRHGPYPPFDPRAVFAGGNVRETLKDFFASTDNRRAGGPDTDAFLACLDTRAEVAGRKVGVVGYCMGGGMALTAAALHPDRIVAAASFHGGNLATDSEMSPHRRAPEIAARVYIGAADEDQSYPPEMARRLEAALDAAGVDYRAELYEGARHGWTQTDFPIYDEAAAERHWRALFDLFGTTLKDG
jgi:carboxymethylenebutenolidase